MTFAMPILAPPYHVQFSASELRSGYPCFRYHEPTPTNFTTLMIAERIAKTF